MKKYIEKWLSEGLINSAQAGKMYADLEKDSSEKSSKKIIFTFSMIGAVLVGIGFILFVASNWQAIPSSVKVLMLGAITFACAFGGYYLGYENKNYPKTGASLLFLSMLLFGALIFLTAQIYHIESSGNLHILVLIWMFSVIPYIYIFSSKSAAVLVSVLFLLWFSVFIFTKNYFGDIVGLFPLIYCLAGIFMFCAGRFSAFSKELSVTSGVFEKFGFFIICISVFLTTFGFFLSEDGIFFELLETGRPVFMLRFMNIMLLVSAAIFLPSFFINPSRSKANIIESALTAALICFCMVLFSKNLIHPGYLRIATNLFFAVMLITMIAAGYIKREMFYVNLGIFWLIIFIAVKYFDFFWRLLPRSLFFLAGGIILVAAALFFEHKRRDLKTEIKANVS